MIYLFLFTAESPSATSAEISSTFNSSQNRSRKEHVVVIPFRSPNDQQQVFAIRTSHVDPGLSSKFWDFND